MNVTQKPETLIVLRDGELDEEYYEMIYEQKRREALAVAKAELIANLTSVPAKLGRAVVYLFVHIAEQAN